MPAHCGHSTAVLGGGHGGGKLHVKDHVVAELARLQSTGLQGAAAKMTQSLNVCGRKGSYAINLILAWLNSLFISEHVLFIK